MENLRQIAESKEGAQTEESQGRERFGKDISNVICCDDIGKIDVQVVNAFTDIVITSVDMFCTHMKTRILHQDKGSFIVHEKRGRMRLQYSDFIHEHSEPHAFTSGFRAGDVFCITG